MPGKLSRILKDKRDASGGAQTVRDYEERFRMAQNGASENEEAVHERVAHLYYDLVTDFYEFGWGRSFHFAPRVPGESFKASLVRHERYLAQVFPLTLSLLP